MFLYLIFYLSSLLSDLHTFEKEARNLRRHISFFVMEPCNRLTRYVYNEYGWVNSFAIAIWKTIYLVHICMFLGLFRWLDLLVDGRHILYVVL